MPNKERDSQDPKTDLGKIVEGLRGIDPRIKSIILIKDVNKPPSYQLEFENRRKYTLSIAQQTGTLRHDFELIETTYVLDKNGNQIKTGDKRTIIDTSKINLNLRLIETSRPITENQEYALNNWLEEWQEERYEEYDIFSFNTERRELSIEIDIPITPSLQNDVEELVKKLIEIAPIVAQKAEKILKENS